MQPDAGKVVPAPNKPTTTGPFTPAAPPPPAGSGGRGRASNPEPTNLWEIFTSISRVLQFPLLLLLLVIAFLIIQDRIDRSDPKLSLAPVYGDPNAGFEPPGGVIPRDLKPGLINDD